MTNSNIYNILSNILIEYYNIKYYRYKKILEIKINLMFMLIYLKIMSLCGYCFSLSIQ